MENIYNFTRAQLENYLISVGEKGFRATQIFEWLYKKNAKSFVDMSNISKPSIEKLASLFTIEDLELIKKQESADGTKKYLFALSDGERIETVLMRHDYGNSVCVSSQVGCNMKCAFCASGRFGKVRDLKTYEMVSQVLYIASDLAASGDRLSHVVIMGIGEPFENYDNVMNFIRIINDGKGLEIGSRHITVSTCGIVPRIYDFCNFELQVNLAISLHFPDNDLRSMYMPVNRAYPLDEVMEAVKVYFSKTSRRVTFEYILLDGINDTPACMKKLINLVKDITCYVNLIPMNETNGKFKRSSEKNAKAFQDGLLKAGVNATLRKEHGGDIDAACGQLRIKEGKFDD